MSGIRTFEQRYSEVATADNGALSSNSRHDDDDDDDDWSSSGSDGNAPFLGDNGDLESNGTGSSKHQANDDDDGSCEDDASNAAGYSAWTTLPKGVILCVCLLVVSASVATLFTTMVGTGGFLGLHFGSGKKDDSNVPMLPWSQPFPAELLDETTGSYDPNGRDFVNSDGKTPPFWENVRDGKNSTHWGPCLPPRPASRIEEAHVDWPSIVQLNKKRTSDRAIEYPRYKPSPNNRIEANNTWGMCLPGFIIVGAGKCGTSSLYHYITGHDRVLPANEKQIHYFKYYPKEPMSWYLRHFPTTETFLGSGALMTGEASPGYLPYPDVAALAAKRLPGPKIIMAARDPLDRAWSSYKYNYVVPALDKAVKGKLMEKSVPEGMTEEYYRENHLFSFEEMLKAELKVLRDCFKPGGTGETRAREKFGNMRWAMNEFQRRDKNGLPPLIDLDDYCYGGKVKHLVPRKQWVELIEKNPDKIINVPNLHLVQSFIGRSLYALPLEWWYIAYPAKDIYLVCNEDMRDNTSDMLNRLTSWMGLPDYDFSDVIAKGMYNVGGNRGYDKPTPWNETDLEAGEGEADEHDLLEEREEEIPISAALRKEVLEFVRPYNERLFELTGQRCNWL